MESGGEYYIFYSANDYEAERAGTYIAVDKLTDMFTVEGSPARVVLPSIKEEIFQKDRFRKGQDWYTIEGAFYFRKGDGHYLLYSGNCYENENYFVGLSYAESKETDLRKVPFRKVPSESVYAPVLRKTTRRKARGTTASWKRTENITLFTTPATSADGSKPAIRARRAPARCTLTAERSP